MLRQGGKRLIWEVNFLVRGLLGTGSIFFVNEALKSGGLPVQVGFNPLSVLITAILGMPGVLLLYALVIYQSL